MGYLLDNSDASPTVALQGAATVGSSFFAFSPNGTDWNAVDKLSVQRLDPIFAADVRFRQAKDIIAGANEINPKPDALLTSITTGLGGSGTPGTYLAVPTLTDFGGKKITLDITVDGAGDVSAINLFYSAGGGYKIGDTITVKPLLLGAGSTVLVITLVADDLVGELRSNYPYQNQTRIHMVLGNDAKFEFELQDLDPGSPYYATWATGTQAGLNAAIQDLSDWISDV